MKKLLLLLLFAVVTFAAPSTPQLVHTPGIVPAFCAANMPSNFTGAIDSLPPLGAGTSNLPCTTTVGGTSATVNGLPFPSAGSLQNLTVSVVTGSAVTSSSFSLVFTVYVNGTASGLTCTTSVSYANNISSPVKCSDNSDTVSINAGDVVSLVVSAPSATPTISPGAAWVIINAALEKI